MTNLEISNAAGDYLAQVIDRESACDTVRLVFGLAGLEPQPSAVLPGDTVFRHNGQTILVLDQTMNLMLADKTLDVEDTQQGPKLRLS